MSNLPCLFTYHDLQIQFQYQKNDFRLINRCLILTVFCDFRGFLMDSKVIKRKWHQIETPSVYSYWIKALLCKFSKWSNIVHTTFWAPQSVIQNYRAVSRIFKKQALLVKFYTEILKKWYYYGEKGHFLSNITKGSIQLPDTDFFWINPCPLTSGKKLIISSWMLLWTFL